jgi:nucleoside-diphosphate-sugar epimerase
MEKVLITGPTGFIGSEVARQLAEKGRRPRLLVRRPLRGIVLKSLDAEITQGDLRSPRSLARAVDGVDTVIHLGARATFERYELLRPSIVEGSVNLMQVAADAGVRTFIYGGSLLVYGDQDQPIAQETPARPQIDYSRAKLEAEQTLLSLAGEAGMRFCSVRLPHVYGANSLLFNEIRRGRVIFPGKGDNLFAHLHVADAAAALIRAAELGKSGVCVVADNFPRTWNELFAVTREYYPRFRVIHVPTRLALFSTGALELLSRFRLAPNLYSPDAVMSWNARLTVEPHTFRNVLGIEPTYPSIEDGIPAVLDDCISFMCGHSVMDRC